MPDQIKTFVEGTYLLVLFGVAAVLVLATLVIVGHNLWDGLLMALGLL